jgi:signal transduction histidine kinase
VKYVLLGWTTFLTFAVITNAILPLITGSAIWSKFGPLASVFMSASISYAIIRHEFLDIKIIIQRGLVYSLLLSIITAVYLFLIFTFEYFFHSDDGTMILISAFLTTLVGIVGVPPLKAYFQKITDPIFFKDTYDYATVLSELTDILNNNIVLDTIIEKTESTLLRALRVEHVTFSFTDTVLDGGGFSLPVTSNSKPLGTLYVGVKRSGDSFTREDISLLKTFTKQAGIALEKASLYKQVEDYAKTLEEKVEERTQEIVAIQKEQETMMLEISHGLQTPLTIMKGELFLMRKQDHDNKRVDTIDASIDRISSFIYRFLSLTKLESAAIVPLSRLNLSSLLTQVILFFEQEAHEKGITLSGTISSDIFVTGIKEELEEMFSNLISNSIKYMRKDGPRGISITLSADKEKATITLSDDGIGIKEENLPNLFKKFYRVKEAETKGIQGTGLGLVICKKIIDKHNGTLHIESVFGEGSTFIITIPII